MSTSVLDRNHVRVLGKGERTLVFGHGFGTDQSVWQCQVDALANDLWITL
jgi:sigma-B regulation protein RsbQ